jgi:hypothetical protein
MKPAQRVGKRRNLIPRARNGRLRKWGLAAGDEKLLDFGNDKMDTHPRRLDLY